MTEREMNCAEAIAALREHFGVKEIGELVRLSGISRGTLDTWNIRGAASKPNAIGRKQLIAILGRSTTAGLESPSSDLAASLASLIAGQTSLLAGQTRIEQRLDALLSIKDPKRIGDMLKAKAQAKELKAQGGGAA